MFGKTARLAVVLSLIGFPVAAQDKDKTPPKTDPKKDAPPPIVLSTPSVVTTGLRTPLHLDSIMTFIQTAGAGGGARGSSDGRYVALNHPAVRVYYRSQSDAPIILRGAMVATLYRGTPPETPTVSVRPTERVTVEQMFADMPRYAYPQFGSRSVLLGTLAPGELTEGYTRLVTPLDSLTSYEYNTAQWTPRSTVIVEVGVPYTMRVDIRHESDGVTRTYRADRVFRYDISGRAIGGPMIRPPQPAPTTTTTGVEVRR